MENEYKNSTIETIKDLYEEYTLAKVIIISLGSLVTVFILGKAAHIVAGSIRGFKNLKKAINE